MDYYHILGVQPSASDSEIKKAYRELSFKYHPDKHVNSSEYQKKENDKKIKELNEAYETLKDSSLRRQYDNRNSNPFQQIFGDIFKQQQHHQTAFRNPYQHAPPPMMNIFDIINEIHGQQGEPIIFTTMYENQTHNTQPTTVQPMEVKLSLTLQQSFVGAQLPILVEREIKNGNSLYKEQERIYVVVPPGIDTDEIITIPEKGNQYNGLKGDVKVQISLKPHEVFERRGLNLIYKHTITFKESILGFDFVLNYIDETSFKVRNLRGTVIQNLEEKTIKGKGFTRDGSTGDLVIVFKVVSPKTLSEEQLVALESVL
jgi:DnaJ family protein B protein 4